MRTGNRRPRPLGGVVGLGLGLERRAEGTHALLALVARGAVEDEDAVEVVHLVLDDPGLQARGLDEDRLPPPVLGLEAEWDGAFGGDVDGPGAEGALLRTLLVLGGPL